MPGHEDIEVPKETVEQMVRLGFAILVEHPIAGDKVAMLTPKGDEWLKTYCEYILGEDKC